jgi:hypothetical protein
MTACLPLSLNHSPIDVPVDCVVRYDIEISSELTSERCDVLKRSGFGSGGSDDDGVFHGIVLFKGLDELGNSGSLLSDGDVDAVKLLALIGSLVPALLVENGIEGDGSLSGLTITNDQFTLTTANGHHGIDRLETSLDGLIDGVTGKNTGGLELGTTPLGSVEGALSINGVSESIDDTAEEFNTDWNIDLLDD